MSAVQQPTVVVLASGRGERFVASGGSGSKLQATLGEKTVLDRTLAAVQASGLPFHVESAGHSGMGDSIAAAVRATANANGWLILPGDMPLLQPSTLHQVAAALMEGGDSAQAYPVYQNQRGHPVGFGRAYYAQLADLSGNQGAARVITAQAAIKLIVTDIGCVTDIDTLADLEQAQKLLQLTT
jgi:molybdenum cofactor cytidylyltransferase